MVVVLVMMVVMLVPMNLPAPLQRSQRRKRTRSVEDDEEGHLIYHNGDMLRARCIEYIPLFSLFLFFVLFFLYLWWDDFV